jgi:hypothetical protein
MVPNRRESFTPLEEEDGLYLFHPSPEGNQDSSSPGAVGRPATLAAGEARFARDFAAVWFRAPEADRRRLLLFWLKPHCLKRLAKMYPQRPRCPCPRIVLTEQVAPPEPGVVSAGGCALIFPDVLLAGEPERLQFAIARALAQVSRYATGEHYSLEEQMIDDPYEAWERRPGRRSGQRKRDAKLEELQREYQQAYDSAVVAVLTRWGFTSPVNNSSPAGAAAPEAQR